MNRIVEVAGRLQDGAIITNLAIEEIIDRVMERKQIVVVKRSFPEDLMARTRELVRAWGETIPPAAADDFKGNYHRKRMMISRLQQAPHCFHDYNFNAIAEAPAELQHILLEVFGPLRDFYNRLTGYRTDLSIPEAGPYVHPQIIHYPSGGGFFGKHWHNLLPQKLGFIVSMANPGQDFRNGGTVFDIDGDIVDMEGLQTSGDICIWRYDYPHWVTQSDLQDKFDWDSAAGRWIATYAYFDPEG